MHISKHVTHTLFVRSFSMSDAETKVEVNGAEALFEADGKAASQDDGDQNQKRQGVEEGAEQDTQKNGTYPQLHEKDDHQSDGKNNFLFTNLLPAVQIFMTDECQQAGRPGGDLMFSLFKQDGLVANFGDSVSATFASSCHITPQSSSAQL